MGSWPQDAEAPPPLRISVTDIDGWRWYMDHDHMDHDAFLRRLTRADPPTPAMSRGHSLHRYLETEGRADADKWACDVDVRLPRPDAREFRVQKDYDCGGAGIVRVSGRVDAIRGNTVIDYKGSSRAADYEYFAHAWQWRLYLDMLPEATDFAYECMQIRDPRRDGDPWRIVKHETIRLGRYPGLADDVAGIVAEYAGMIHALAGAGHVHLSPYKGCRRVQPAEERERLEAELAKQHEALSRYGERAP